MAERISFQKIGGDFTYKIVSNRRVKDTVVFTVLALSVYALIFYSKTSAAAAKDGLMLCINVIIPSLFPFFVASSLIVELGFADKLGRVFEPIMQPLFNIGGVCAAAFTLGFIGGYPVGAKTAISLYKNGSIAKDEAERLLSFCNNSGPAFIFGVVGAGIFSSSAIGLLLYGVHMLSSVIVGLLFRNWGRSTSFKARTRPIRVEAIEYSTAFAQSVTGSFSSMLNISAFVIFFTVIIKLLFVSGALPFLASMLAFVLKPIGINGSWCERLLTGVIELTSGVWRLKEVAYELRSAITMAAFMLGWAGLSVHCQVLSFISGSGLSVKSYIIGKFAHGGISALLISILTRFLPLKEPVAAYLAEQVEGMAALDFHTALLISSVFSVVLVLFFFVMSVIFCRKKYGALSKKSI